jgi:hypothetical protein
MSWFKRGCVMKIEGLPVINVDESGKITVALRAEAEPLQELNTLSSKGVRDKCDNN